MKFIQFSLVLYIKELLQNSCDGKIVLEQYKKKNFNNSIRNDWASLVIKAEFSDDPDEKYFSIHSNRLKELAKLIKKAFPEEDEVSDLYMITIKKIVLFEKSIT